MIQVKVDIEGVQVAIVNIVDIGWKLGCNGFGYYGIKGYEFRNEFGSQFGSLREYTAEGRLLYARDDEPIPILEFVLAVLKELTKIPKKE